MNIDSLLRLPHTDIDYSALDVATLGALALQPDDPFIATSALGELSLRNVPDVASVATAIVTRPDADRFLVSYAIHALFAADTGGAVAVLERMVPSLVDPKILDALIDGVLGDSEFFASEAGRPFARAVQERVRRVTPDWTCDAENWTTFLSRVYE